VLVGKSQRLRLHQYFTHLFVFLSRLITWRCYSSVSRMGEHCPIKRNSSNRWKGKFPLSCRHGNLKWEKLWLSMATMGIKGQTIKAKGRFCAKQFSDEGLTLYETSYCWLWKLLVESLHSSTFWCLRSYCLYSPFISGIIPDLCCQLEWNSPAWVHKILLRLTSLNLIIVMFVFSSVTHSVQHLWMCINVQLLGSSPCFTTINLTLASYMQCILHAVTLFPSTHLPMVSKEYFNFNFNTSSLPYSGVKWAGTSTV